MEIVKAAVVSLALGGAALALWEAARWVWNRCGGKRPKTGTGTDVHNDTLANPHEIKVFGSRRIYFTEKI